MLLMPPLYVVQERRLLLRLVRAVVARELGFLVALVLAVPPQTLGVLVAASTRIAVVVLLGRGLKKGIEH